MLEDLREAGRTIFLSSHVLSEVERVCDRVGDRPRRPPGRARGRGDLLARRKRHVEIRAGTGRRRDLTAVPGVSGLVATDGRVELALEGDVRPFLAAIAGAPIVDLTIEPARLEDAFLEYYADADEPPAGGGVMNGALLALTWRQQRLKLLIRLRRARAVRDAAGRRLRRVRTRPAAILESGLIPQGMVT